MGCNSIRPRRYTMTQLNEFSTVAEIKEFLDQHGVAYAKRAKKGDLIRLMQAVQVENTRKEETAVELMSPADIQRSRYIERLLQDHDSFVQRVDDYIFLRGSVDDADPTPTANTQPDTIESDFTVHVEDEEPRMEQTEPEVTQPEPQEDPQPVADTEEVDSAETQEETVFNLDAMEPVVTPTAEPVVPLTEEIAAAQTEPAPLELEEDTEEDKPSNVKRLTIVGGVVVSVFIIVWMVVQYLM